MDPPIIISGGKRTRATRGPRSGPKLSYNGRGGGIGAGATSIGGRTGPGLWYV